MLWQTNGGNKMVYMGSKAKYAKHIVPILQKTIDENNIDTYIECFVGGANIIDKINCTNKYGYDRSDTLIALLQTAATDFSKVLKDGSRELWDKGKDYVKLGKMPEDMTLAEIGAMEFLLVFLMVVFLADMQKILLQETILKKLILIWKNRLLN